ncbi:MAG: SpoIIE family protein phosphatase [Deltaproteobacteria bacterium]|nr:SpoIIE family protein phosphatase [Deltaproteobacteria bacterium]
MAQGLKNLEFENRRLKEEIRRLRREADRNRGILDFHDKLEKDFLSAGSLEDLIIKLINCLQLREDIDFVSLCLTAEYLEGMLGVHAYDRLLSGIDAPRKMGYLSLVREEDLMEHLGRALASRFEKTPQGSLDMLFPGHGDEVRSTGTVPLLLRAHIIGSLNIGSIRTRHYYTSETGADLLDRLSAKLAIAIDNILSHGKLSLQKEILDRDIDRAALLQKSLLPSAMMETDTLRIAAFFQPCHRLGGDLYDFVHLSQEKTALIIADVSGHGISAALVAAMLKSSLQMDGIEALSPSEVLSKINGRFCRIFRHEDYITLCYGIIDTGKPVIRLARAGHPYPVLVRPASGGYEELAPPGPPVGLEEGASYETAEFNLASGDMIFFYTDGLLDAVPGGEDPEVRKRFILRLAGAAGGGNTWEGLRSEMDGLLGGRDLEDDTSLVIATLK